MRTDQETHYLIDGFLGLLRQREAETARRQENVGRVKSMAVGVIYDKEAENALLANVILRPDEAMLERLVDQDFGDPINRFIVRELRMMNEAGQQFWDPVAMARWFRNGGTRQRFTKECGKELEPTSTVLSHVLTIGDKYYTSSANNEYYYQCLRKERLRRAFAGIARKLWYANQQNQEEPWKTLADLQRDVNAVWSLCHELFDKEMDK